jgi:hypothetical protein
VGFHLFTLAIVSLPFDQLAIDLARLLLISNTRYQALKTKLAKKVATELLKIFIDFGLPKILQLDNDLAFTRRVMDNLHRKFGFQHCSVISYFPQQNGAVKRYFGEAIRMVFKTIHGDTVK